MARRTDRSLSSSIDRLRVFWYRRVVSFDQESQVQTLKEAKQLAQSALERLRRKLTLGAAAFKAWWRAPWDTRRTIGIVEVLVGAAALTFLWRGLRAWFFRRSLLRRTDRRDDPIRREAGRWLRRLGSPPASTDPALLSNLQRLRYGARQTWPNPTITFRRARTAARR
jgi:hypothetical protein